jgi:hypothetical protein
MGYRPGCAFSRIQPDRTSWVETAMFKRLEPKRKTGAEAFTDEGAALGFSVLDFWQWSSSNLVGNTLRGLVAEFLVARAVGVGGDIRNQWDPYDVTTSSSLRIEVKSAAYLQSWAQRVESSISFDVRETLAWDADANAFAPESDRRRQADLYVFAVLAHREKATLNPLDVSQWEFYLLETAILNKHVKKQRRISLERVLGLSPVHCGFADLLRHITEIEARTGLTLLGAGAKPLTMG